MGRNLTFCSGCSERGKELGLLRAENTLLRTKLSLACAKAEALEVLLAREPRRDVLGSPLLNRPYQGQW